MATVEETARLELRRRLFGRLATREAVDALARDLGAYLREHPDDLELRIEGSMLVRLQEAFDDQERIREEDALEEYLRIQRELDLSVLP